MIRSIGLGLCLTLLPLFGAEGFVRGSVRETLMKVPAEDRDTISEFFRGLLSQGSFSSVLFGPKPCSSHDCVWWFVKAQDERTRNLFFLQEKGYRVWQKYQALFPSSRFAFIDQGYSNGVFSFLFAKAAAREALEALNRGSFKGAELEKKFGEILGYPAKDIEDFAYRKKIELTLNFFPYEHSPDVYENSFDCVLDLLDGYPENLVAKIEHYDAHFKPRRIWLKADPFFPSTSMGCMSFEEEKVSDSKLQKKIADLYNSEKFLEEMLTLLMDI